MKDLFESVDNYKMKAFIFLYALYSQLLCLQFAVYCSLMALVLHLSSFSFVLLICLFFMKFVELTCFICRVQRKSLCGEHLKFLFVGVCFLLWS